MSSPYAAATPEKIKEIIRLAEARLEAQLTVGLAADQRAMTFASFLAAIDTALIGTLALLPGHPAAHWPLVIMTCGFSVAALLAVVSARPILWDEPGYRPGLWIDDIATGDTIENGFCAMAEHYDEAIGDNERAMKANGRLIRFALIVVVASLAAGGLTAAV